MNIDEVQRRLWEQSQAHRQHRESGTPLFPTNPYGGRIRNLMDLMHNPAWIAAACDADQSRYSFVGKSVRKLFTIGDAVNQFDLFLEMRKAAGQGD